MVDLLLLKCVGLICLVIFDGLCHGIHHHHSPPFGRICLELFPDMEQANPRMCDTILNIHHFLWESYVVIGETILSLTYANICF